MKTYRLCFLLLAMLMAMPLTVNAEFVGASSSDSVSVETIVIPAGNGAINLDSIREAEIDSLTKVAEQGSVEAQKKLGRIYRYKDYDKQDYKEALKWYRKAAEQGDDEAQRVLGEYYRKGSFFDYDDVDEHDYAEAAKWYRKAAEQGNAKAQSELGNLYCEGNGVKQDYAEAAKWYRKAAEQGDYEAQEKLGALYAAGKGVKQDYDEAVKLYLKAVDYRSNEGFVSINYIRDCNNLGDIYAAKHDYTEAVKWYSKVVDSDKENYYIYDRAQLKLGLCYAFGKGVKQDFSEATKLIKGLIKGFIEDFTKEMGIAVYLLLGLLLLMLISGFTIFYHRNKQLGLAKRIIFALVFSFALTALFSLSISMLMFLISMIINAYSLIASDFLMLFVLSFLTILCLGFSGASLLMIGQPKSTNSISAESENETPENTLMDGKKGRKVKFNKSTVNLIGIAVMLLSFLVGFPYYWFTTKALGHEPLSTYLGYQEDPPQFIISLFIFVIALIIGLISIFLLSRLVCGWRNFSFKTGDWKRGVSIGFFIINPIKKSRYIKGKVVPFILFGLLPLLVSPFVNSIGLFFLGAFFISTTADGLIPVWKIRKESHDRMIQDIKGENAVFVLDENQSNDKV